MNSVSLYAESLKCYKWSHFTVLPVQCRARLSMAVTAASNARSRAWGAKKKRMKSANLASHNRSSNIYSESIVFLSATSFAFSFPCCAVVQETRV